MAYSTVAQVASEFKNITFSATTSITESEVERFIDESDALIDAKLSQVYVTPVTGTVSLLVVQQISIWFSAQRVRDIQMLKTGQNNTNQLDGGKRLDDMAMERLDQILDDELPLPDATLLQASGAVKSYNASNNISGIFKRDSQQW